MYKVVYELKNTLMKISPYRLFLIYLGLYS